MKNIMMDTAQVTCGLSKGPCRHKETWWWNEEVAEAVKAKKKKYGNWRKEKSTEAWEEYKKSNQNTKKVISLAKGKKQRECARDLNDPNQQNEIFRIAKHCTDRTFCPLKVEASTTMTTSHSSFIEVLSTGLKVCVVIPFIILLYYL